MGAPTTPNSLREYLTQLLWQVIPSLAVYFGLRALGIAAYIAILAAVVFGIAQSAFDVARGRAVDPFVVIGFVYFGAAAVLILVTKNPRYGQFATLGPGVIGALALLVSACVGNPLTRAVTANYRADLAPDALPARGWAPEDVLRYTAMHRSTSLVCGFLVAAQMCAFVLVLRTCSVDVTQLFLDVFGAVSSFAVIAYAVRRIRRFVAAADSSPALSARQAPAPEPHRTAP